MPHLDPLDPADLPGLADLFEPIRAITGFVPASYLTMARRPEILRRFADLAAAVFVAGTTPPGLRQLVAHVASTAAGCRYCQAHTAANASRMGVDPDRIGAVWDFERAPGFTDAERAALRLARDAATVPNRVTAAHFDELRRHFDEAEIVELVAVISLFGFLNRWNDTMASPLEEEPHAFAARHVHAWEPGKHA